MTDVEQRRFQQCANQMRARGARLEEWARGEPNVIRAQRMRGTGLALRGLCFALESLIEEMAL